MSESVSRFQAEVAAVMEVLLKVAVIEITKVFEGRSGNFNGCTDEPETRIKEDLVCVPDIKVRVERALSGLSERMVRSVGVQAGETPLLQQDELGSGEQPETLSPSESLWKEPAAAVDFQCMVDLPCSIFKQTSISVEAGSGIPDAPWSEGMKKPDPVQENGLPGLSALVDPCSHSVDPDLHPFSSVLDSFPSDALSANTTSEWDLGLADVTCLPAVKKSDVPQSAELLGETSDQRPSSAKSKKKVCFQLTQTHPFDCKLLRPCSVQLVNLLMLPGAHKLNGNNRMYPCPLKDLRVHHRVHSGRRLCCFKDCGNGVWRLQGETSQSHAHVCKMCSKKFKRKKALKRHERFHTGEKPHSCSRCKKTFALHKSLRRHERFHTGKRPHVCPHCRKGFRLKNNLKVHLRFHTGDKPFICSLCSKAFRIEKNLEKHRLLHSVPVSFRTLQ